MDGEYIKRLQKNASNKLHQGYENEIRLNSTSIDNEKQLVTSEENGIEQCENKHEENSNTSEPILDTVKFKNKITSLSLSNILPNSAPDAMNTKSFSKSNVILESTNEIILKPTSRSTVKQPKFEEIESILAKITCSQRTICSVVDSLL